MLPIELTPEGLFINGQACSLPLPAGRLEDILGPSDRQQPVPASPRFQRPAQTLHTWDRWGICGWMVPAEGAFNTLSLQFKRDEEIPHHPSQPFQGTLRVRGLEIDSAKPVFEDVRWAGYELCSILDEEDGSLESMGFSVADQPDQDFDQVLADFRLAHLDEDTYRELYDEDEPVGWHAIDQVVDRLYGEQKPRHYAAVPHYSMGGEDPLDGISVYDSTAQEPHLHLVGYGLSELYFSPECVGNLESGWGFEFTMRLKREPDVQGDPGWAMNLMNNLARYVFNSGNTFDEGHIIPAKGPIKVGSDTALVAIAFAVDPELGTIQTPHGRLTFLQLVGVTEAEFQSVMPSPTIADVTRLLERLRQDNPLLITDLARR